MKDTIHWTLLKNDLKKNKAINLALFLFLFLSALFMATGISVIERLTGSLDQVYERAKTPHFLQMHVGDIDEGALETFAESQDGLEAMEIQDMADIDGADISYKKASGDQGSFSDSLLDNYFVKQNQSLDYLLDARDNSLAQVGPGELGLPLAYAKKYGLDLGDKVHISQGEFQETLTITSLLRDGQMGSSMASSIRFLLDEGDFEDLYKQAEKQESIISFYLKDPSQAGSLQTAYKQDKNLPKNGVAISLSLIKLVNGLGDGLMSGLLILASLVLIGISLINLRFTLLTTIEKNLKQIGTLKALGLKNKDINRLYQGKYLAMTGLGALLGSLASFPLSQAFLGNISLNFGLSEPRIWTYILPFIGGLVVYLLVALSLRGSLRKLGKLSPLEALLGEGLPRKKKRAKEKEKRAPMRVFGQAIDESLAWQGLKVHWSSWKVLTLVFFFATLSLLLPLNLWTILDSPNFMEYMGAAKSHIRMSLDPKHTDEASLEDLKKTLDKDPDIDTYRDFKTYMGQVEGEDGPETFLLEAGDYQAFPIQMDEGRLPTNNGEIAVSGLNAKHFDWDLGSDISLDFSGKTQNFKLVGIYQDITHGGMTAKTSQDIDGDLANFTFYVNLKDQDKLDQWIKNYQEDFPEASILAMDSLLDQTLGSLTDSLALGNVAIFVMVISLCTLIVLLFINLELHRSYSFDAILSSLGFTFSSLQKMYLEKALLASLIGIGLGSICSLILGPALLGGLFSLMGFGITRLDFTIYPSLFILLGFLLPCSIVLVVTYLVTRKIRNVSLMNLGNA